MNIETQPDNKTLLYGYTDTSKAQELAKRIYPSVKARNFMLYFADLLFCNLRKIQLNAYFLFKPGIIEGQHILIPYV